MAEAADINVINPDGKLVAIPANAAADALQAGYRVPTPEEQTEFNQQQKYGVGTANEAKAFAAGAGRGATFGASDYALTKSGLVNPETLAGLKQYNPTASVTGEIAGAIAPTLLAPESIAGRLPVGLLGKGARAIEAGVEGLGGAAARLAGEGSLAARGLETAGNIAAKTLGGAAEGAAFGAGNAFSEDALGNPEPLGESLLANAGYGAAWGGALGGLLGVGESAIPKAAEVARGALKSSYEKIFGRTIPEGAEDLADITGGVPPAASNGVEAVAPKPQNEIELGLAQKGYAQLASKFTGTPVEELEQKLANPTEHALMSPSEKSAHRAQMMEGVGEMYKAGNDLLTKTTHEIKPQAFEKLLENVDPSQAQGAWASTADDLKSVADKIRSSPTRYYESMADRVDELRKELESSVHDETKPAEIMNKLDDLKRTIDSENKSSLKAMDKRERDTAHLIKDAISTPLRSTLENEAVFGKAAATQQGYNAAVTDFIKAKTDLEQDLMAKRKSTGKFEPKDSKFKTYTNQFNANEGQRVTGVVHNYMDSLHNLSQKSEEMHSLAGEKFNKEVIDDILSRGKGNITTAENRFGKDKELQQGFFSDWQTALLPVVGNLPFKIASMVSRGLSDPNMIISKLSHIDGAVQSVSKTVDKLAKKAFEPLVATAEAAKEGAKKVLEKEDVDKKIEETTKRVESIDNMHKELDDATKQISGVAPKITSAAQRAMIQGAIFLHSKIPDWSDNTSQQPFDGKKPYSKSESEEFVRYHDAVEDPKSVMAQAVSGRSNPQGIETLQAVYPNLYANMKNSLLNEIVSKKAKNPDINIPYQKRIAIGEFLGMSLDSSQNPMNVMANQAIMASKAQEKKQQEQAMINPTQKGLSNIDLAGRYETPAQQNNKREA